MKTKFVMKGKYTKLFSNYFAVATWSFNNEAMGGVSIDVMKQSIEENF